MQWTDVDFAVGGSRDGGHADALVKDLGLTGTPFMSVYNGCATGGSALLSGSNGIAAGMADLVLVLGFDKHDPAAPSPPIRRNTGSVTGSVRWV